MEPSESISQELGANSNASSEDPEKRFSTFENNERVRKKVKKIKLKIKTFPSMTIKNYSMHL